MSPLEIIAILFILLINGSFLAMMLGMMLGADFGVPFVPSGQRTVEKMIEIAEIKPGEVVFDLGCGDGRFVFAAAKKGAYATGIEFSPAVFLFAKTRQLLSRQKNVSIRYGNFFSPRFRQEIENADVLLLFLLPPLMKKIFLTFFPKMKKGARVISHGFGSKIFPPTKIIPRKDGRGRILIFKK